MYKNVKHVKVKEESFKCIKWGQECINTYKKIVINAKVKDRLLEKEVNVKLVMERRFYRKKRLSRLQSKRVFQIITQ